MYTFVGDMKNHIFRFCVLFNDSLFIFSDSATLESSSFIKDPIVLSCVLSLKYVKVLSKIVSSAYIINLNMLLACEK